MIDAHLAEAGWVVQSRDQVNLGAGVGVAVREFGTATGPADYALFVERTLCGVLEAKADGTTLSGFSETATRYMGGVPAHLVRREGQVRFEYVASSTEILFRDHADPAPRSRRVFFFHQPETLRRWLSDPVTIRGRLQTMPPLVTTDLRECQIEAVTGLEASLAADKPRALIQAATGAGKTFTACAFSYRLLEYAKFRRVLFLADRANLVRQARDEFVAYRPPGSGRSFTELYNVQRLGPAGLDKDAAVVIATIQRGCAALSGRELSEEDEEQSAFEAGAGDAERIVRYNPAIPIESFDLVVTDECHRSIYGTWRQVLEYFDAFIVGLTATPSLHTMGFFNKNLVAQYPYERSVADGVNVGYEIYRIRTDIGERGGAIPKGYEVPVRDKRTRADARDALLGAGGQTYDVILTNPPFGKKQSYRIVRDDGEIESEREDYDRQDFFVTTSNKQLNFLQHIMTVLAENGEAAVVLPDNVLFEGGAGETIRRRLLHNFDFHTLLRLPTGIFYKQGVKANVLFFDKKRVSAEANTKHLWIYDLRTNQRFTLKERPMVRADLDDFVACYKSGRPYERAESERFRRFAYADLIVRDKINLDIFWLKDDTLDDPDLLPPPDEIAAEIVENLEAALDRFRRVALSLQVG